MSATNNKILFGPGEPFNKKLWEKRFGKKLCKSAINYVNEKNKKLTPAEYLVVYGTTHLNEGNIYPDVKVGTFL